MDLIDILIIFGVMLSTIPLGRLFIKDMSKSNSIGSACREQQ